MDKSPKRKKEDRSNKERYNVSIKSLYRLGINPYGITGFHAIYLQFIAPQFIEEVFNDAMEIPWIFKANKAHKSMVLPKRYKMLSYEEIFKVAKVMDIQTPVTKEEQALKVDLRLIELAGLIHQPTLCLVKKKMRLSSSLVLKIATCPRTMTTATSLEICSYFFFFFFLSFFLSFIFPL